MAIGSSIKPVAAVAPASPALPVSLTEGDILEARVAAILANGQVRLATALGTTDVATSIPLQLGATIKLQVQSVGAQLTLALLSQGLSTEAAPLPATSVGGSALPAAQQALAGAIQVAIDGQDSPAALFANLKPLVNGAAGAQPTEVKAAASALLLHAIKAEAPVTAATVKAAVQNSGVFREARLAAGDSGAASPAGDMKTALLALRTALAVVVASSPEPDSTSANAPATPGAPTQTERPTLTPAMMAALARLPSAAREAAIAALSAAAADAPSPGPLSATGLEAGTRTAASSGQVAARPSPLPPRIDLPPRAEASAEPSLRLDATRGETARLLLDQTDSALDRIRLSQYGALHRDDPALLLAVQRDNQPAWIFDVPVLHGQGASNAQVRITQDGGRGVGDAASRRWSVEFALETSQIGPVHAQIRMYGRHIGVTLWAERPETARTFRDKVSELHDALGQAEFEVEDVAVLAGSPTAPQAERGYFVDTRS